MPKDLIDLPLRAILIGDFMPGNGEIVERIEQGERVEIFTEDGCTFEGHQQVWLGVEELAISDWDKDVQHTLDKKD